MKKGKKLFRHLPVLLSLLALSVLMSGAYLYQHFSGAKAAGAGREITVSKDYGSNLGTPDNPFLIVEIVPNLSCAEIGYLIPGQEPVSLYQLGTTQSNAVPFLKRMGCDVTVAGESITVNTKPNAIMTAKKDTMTKFEDEERDPAATFTPWVEKYDPNGKEVEGYYQRVYDGSGTFNLEESRFGEFTFEPVQAATGGSVETSSGGAFRWVSEENTQQIATDYNADVIWTTRTEEKYYEGTRLSITNNDVFVKNVFDSDSDKYKVKVVTLTPADLGNSTTLKLLEQANMIYINGTAHTSSAGGDSLVNVWKAHNVMGPALSRMVLDADDEGYTSFIKNDIPWTACKMIYERMAVAFTPATGSALTNGTYGRPIVVMDGVSDFSGIADRTTGTDIEGNNKCLNVYKLYMMLKQYSPSKFYDTFYNPASGNKVTDGSANGHATGSYNGQTTWKYNGSDTFFVPPLNAGSPKADQISAGMKKSWVDASYESAEDSIYVFDKSTSMLDTFLDPYVARTAYDYNKIVYDWYDDESGTVKQTLSSAEILKALIHINVEYKSELNILEIEPAMGFQYDESNPAAVDYFTKLFPWFEGGSANIHVTKMPTWEFIGNIDDLTTTYDMIYIGSLDGGLDINNRNDTTLNGYTYIPVGDTTGKYMRYNSMSSYWVGYDSTDIRYSDNDISYSKYKDLVAFMDAGKPIVFDASFYSGDSTSVTKVAWHNGADQTYMYKLANLANDSAYYNKTLFNYKNLVTNPDAGAVSAMRRATYKESCKLVFYDELDPTAYPLPYSYTKGAYDSIVTETYNAYTEVINGRPEKTLRYRFMIQGDSSQEYTASLFIDSNSDGIYRGSANRPLQYDSAGELKEESEEVLKSSIDIRNDSGNKASMDKLKANQWYTISRQLGDNYKGIIPWKLEVVMNGTGKVSRSSKIDYSLFEVDPADIEEVRVLQIFCGKKSLISTNADGTLNMAASQAGNAKTSTTLSLDTGTVTCNWNNDYQFEVFGTVHPTGYSTNDLFKRYIANVNEFNIHIYQAEAWDIPNIMGGLCASQNNNQGTAEDWWMADPDIPVGSPSGKRLNAWLDEQNISMIIFGFQDTHSYPDNSEFHKAMKQYIDEDERAVIFCHDQVCSYMGGYYGTSTNVNNNDMRFWVGQNRYESAGYDRDSFGAVGGQISLHGFTIRTRPMRGPNNLILMGGANDTYTFFDDNNNILNTMMGHSGMPYTFYKDRVTTTGAWWPDGVVTRWISKANSGQITEYPYQISDFVNTGDTHTQYFQLDLENDDITPWFTLSDVQSESFPANGLKDHKGFYSSRERDARNSFYIYNKGNITYTGMGHKTNMSYEEVRLFVNTMIASFRAQPEKPSAKLVDDNGDYLIEDSGIAGVDYQINVVKDDDLDPTKQFLTVKFKVKDTTVGLASRRKYEVVFKYYDNNGVLHSAVIPFDCSGCTYDAANYMSGTSGGNGLYLTGPPKTPILPSTEEVTGAKKAYQDVPGAVRYKVDANKTYEIYVPLSMLYDLKDASGNPLTQKETADGQHTLYNGTFLYNIEAYSRVSQSTTKKNNTVDDMWFQIQEIKQFNLD